MIEKVIIVGAGGQGIMLMGRVLAEVALREGLNVTWLPSYGAEVRGGAAYCMVTISSFDIPSPYIDKADALIIMNEPSFFKFKGRIKDKGLLLINSSLVNPNLIKHKTSSAKKTVFLPFTEIAAKLGNIKVANMVALGAYLARRKTLKIKNVFQAFKEMAPDKKGLIEINKQAISRGMELIK